MTEGELALANHVLEQVKEGKEFSMGKEEKVDLDSVTDYFNNLLLNIEKNKKRGKVKGQIITYQLSIVIGR